MGAISFIIPFTSFCNIPLLLHFGRLHHHRHHRADVISRRAVERTLPPTSTIYASPRPARLHCEQIWLRFSQQRRRFGTWGLVGGTWDLGKKERGELPLGLTCPHCAQICPRFLDLENNGWEGGKELRMRTRPNWLLDTCPNQ